MATVECFPGILIPVGDSKVFPADFTKSSWMTTKPTTPFD